MGLLGGKKLRVCLAVSIRYISGTDGQTDMQNCPTMLCVTAQRSRLETNYIFYILFLKSVTIIK